MNDQRFPFHRLPHDLRLQVLQTTEHIEILAFSFTSKKAYSIVKDLRLPTASTGISIMKRHPQIGMQFGRIRIDFLWKMKKKKGKKTNFSDLPAKVEVSRSFNHRVRIFKWSNQGMSLGEWIQHLFLISKPEKRYVAGFHVYNSIEFDIPTLRNIFPKLGGIYIFFCNPGVVNEHEKMSAQIFLKAFLPDVEKLRLGRVRFGEHFCIGDFGMANLKELEMSRPDNLRVEDLLTLNAESITIEDTNVAEITLRDWNRFFKLWKKGFNPKLKKLNIWWYTRTTPDWNVFLKGLKADNAGEEIAPEDPVVLMLREEGYVWVNEGEAARNLDVAKKFIIRNSGGLAAEIKFYTRTFQETTHVEFNVSI